MFPTGWHAIEFLLWGQDSSLETAGTRKAQDYLPGDPFKERRRIYLKEVSSLLLEHINWLNAQWSNTGQGRITFLENTDPGGAILTGIATLAGFELSSERMLQLSILEIQKMSIHVLVIKPIKTLEQILTVLKRIFRNWS